MPILVCLFSFLGQNIWQNNEAFSSRTGTEVLVLWSYHIEKAKRKIQQSRALRQRLCIAPPVPGSSLGTPDSVQEIAVQVPFLLFSGNILAREKVLKSSHKAMLIYPSLISPNAAQLGLFFSFFSECTNIEQFQNRKFPRKRLQVAGIKLRT